MENHAKEKTDEIKRLINRAKRKVKSSDVILDAGGTALEDSRAILGNAWELAREAVALLVDTSDPANSSVQALSKNLEESFNKFNKIGENRSGLTDSAVILHRLIIMTNELRIRLLGSPWDRRRHMGLRILVRTAVGLLIVGLVAMGIVTWFSTPKTDEGLSATYFTEMNFKGHPFKKIDHEIDFKWLDAPPIRGLQRNGFSVRWEGCIAIDEGKETTLVAGGDDGIRVFVDDKLIIDDWGTHYFRHVAADAPIKAGIHKIKVEHTEKRGNASAFLGMKVGKGPEKAVPPSHLIPLGGNSAHECPEK